MIANIAIFLVQSMPIYEVFMSTKSITQVQHKPFIWPSDPAFLSEETKIKIEALINRAIPSMRGEHADRYKEALAGVPKLDIRYGREEAIWNTGIKLDAGTDTEVYKCYSPVTGNYYAVKSFDNETYEAALSAYRMLKNKPHCVQMKFPGTNRVYEPLYDCDLFKVIVENQLTSTKDKIRAITQIVEAVYAMHSVNYINNRYLHTEKLSLKGSLSHRDLSIGNVVVVRNGNNELTFDVGDYSRVVMLEKDGNYYSTSPESAINFQTPRERILFQHNNGTRMDIWQLAQLIGAILEETVAPFSWIREMSTIPTVDGITRDQMCSVMSKVKESDINSQIAVAVKKVENGTLPSNEKQALLKTWKMVHKYMLRVDPAKRMPIDYILKKIHKVQKIYDGSTK